MLICIREINADDRYYDMPKKMCQIFTHRCAYMLVFFRKFRDVIMDIGNFS